MIPLALLLACTSTPDTTADDSDTPAPSWPQDTWNRALPAAADAIAAPRDLTARRAVFHLHSPFSHDACDGAGWVDGALDTTCRDQLRQALCDVRFDVAFVTDHPDFADTQAFEDRFHPQEGDSWVTDGDGRRYALDVSCPDGHVVQWRSGYEDELMPVSMHAEVEADPAVRHELLNAYTPDAVTQLRDRSDGFVMLAHTEQRDVAVLETLQDAGLHAVEAFNVHAMLDPDIRSEALGLDPLGWLQGFSPFLLSTTDMEPDLMFMAVHEEQAPSIAAWDALLARGPMMATAGSDAHQNVLAGELIDGERGDSYRRVLRWFSTILLARGTDAAAIDEAVASRRAFVAFEAYGTPTGLDVHLERDGEIWEMGSDAPGGGTLVVTCPTLADGSPYGADAPEITATVYKDGSSWQTGCGSWEVDAGVYRVRFDITPHHLAPFLGDAAADYIKALPWVYSGAIRVGG